MHGSLSLYQCSPNAGGGNLIPAGYPFYLGFQECSVSWGPGPEGSEIAPFHLGYFLQTFGSLLSHIVSWEQAIQSPGVVPGSLNFNAFVHTVF